MSRRTLVFTVALGISVSSLSTIVWSQTRDEVDQAAREVDRPVREEVEAKLWSIPKEPPKIKEEKPKKVEGPTFFVKKIDLVGTESFPPEDFQPIVEKYENKEDSIEDLNILAGEIKREYLRRGIISACFLPPQDVKDGVVTLQVVEAHMGDLEVEDHSFYDKECLKRYWTIKPGEVLRYDKMSRCLQIMNKNPDREVRTTLHAGKVPQTTDVLLNVKTYFPIHVTASYDNEGAPSTGKLRKGVGIRDNNFLFVDDTLIYGYTYGDYFSGTYFYHRVPVTNIGTTFMYGYNFSKAAPRGDYEFLGSSSRVENFSFFGYQDVFHKEEYLGEVYCGMDAKDKTSKQITGTTGRDRLRIIRVGGNLVFRKFGGTTYVSPELSQGINGFGARRKDDLSSRGAENTFTKFKMGLRHKRPLPWWDLQVSLNLKCMLASEKLASQEQFYMGGIDSVRGYPSGDFLADDAYQSNLEVLIPAFIIPEAVKFPYADHPLRDDITGVVFFDYAHGIRKSEASGLGAIDKANFASVGAGLRIRLFNQALLRLEWGIPTGGDKPITEASSSRLHFSIDFEDQLPREIIKLQEKMAEERMEKKAQALVDEELDKPDSEIREKLYNTINMARTAEEEGDLEKARKYNSQVLDMTQSLQAQALEYVKRDTEYKKELKTDNKLLKKYQKKGELEKAEELQKKIEEAEKTGVAPLQLTL